MCFVSVFDCARCGHTELRYANICQDAPKCDEKKKVSPPDDKIRPGNYVSSSMEGPDGMIWALRRTNGLTVESVLTRLPCKKCTAIVFDDSSSHIIPQPTIPTKDTTEVPTYSRMSVEGIPEAPAASGNDEDKNSLWRLMIFSSRAARSPDEIASKLNWARMGADGPCLAVMFYSQCGHAYDASLSPIWLCSCTEPKRITSHRVSSPSILILSIPKKCCRLRCSHKVWLESAIAPLAIRFPRIRGREKGPPAPYGQFDRLPGKPN
ncbi:hypothetical protein SCUP515_00329 [Seiridium cupressi]